MKNTLITTLVATSFISPLFAQVITTTPPHSIKAQQIIELLEKNTATAMKN